MGWFQIRDYIGFGILFLNDGSGSDLEPILLDLDPISIRGPVFGSIIGSE